MNQKNRLTDLLIDGKIEQKDYDEKKLSFQRKLHQITEEKAYLEENIGQQKNIRMKILVCQMMERQGITEEMKAHDQMEWVRAVNGIRNMAEEIVLKELIYR